MASKFWNFRENVIEKAKTICEDHISEIFDNWVQTGVPDNTLITYGDQILDHLTVHIME